MASLERKGMISIVIPAIIWGTVGINVRLLSKQGLEPFTINFFNMLIGSIFIYYFAKYKGHKVQFKHSANVTKHLILQGVFFSLTVILLFFAFIHTSISDASFIQQTMPLWVMVLPLNRMTIIVLLLKAGYYKGRDLLSFEPWLYRNTFLTNIH